jgi:hypothetical protein
VTDQRCADPVLLNLHAALIGLDLVSEVTVPVNRREGR